VHQRVVLVAFAGIQIPRVEGVQAFVVAHGPRFQIVKTADDSQQEQPGVQNQLPIEGKQAQNGCIQGYFLGGGFTFYSQGVFPLLSVVAPAQPQHHLG
jgi:hypothetical protein